MQVNVYKFKSKIKLIDEKPEPHHYGVARASILCSSCSVDYTDVQYK
jgi:hypothetical protein